MNGEKNVTLGNVSELSAKLIQNKMYVPVCVPVCKIESKLRIKNNTWQ